MPDNNYNVPDKLWKEWKSLAPDHLRQKGFDLSDNPALAETVDSIAALYIPRCMEKFNLLKEIRANDQTLQDSDLVGDDYNKLLIRAKEMDKALSQFDKDLVQLNSLARGTLIKSAGFEKEADKSGIADNPEEMKKLAVKLLSPVIKLSVGIAMEASEYTLSFKDDLRVINAAKEIIPKRFE